MIRDQKKYWEGRHPTRMIDQEGNLLEINEDFIPRFYRLVTREGEEPMYVLGEPENICSRAWMPEWPGVRAVVFREHPEYNETIVVTPEGVFHDFFPVLRQGLGSWNRGMDISAFYEAEDQYQGFVPYQGDIVEILFNISKKETLFFGNNHELRLMKYEGPLGVLDE